MQYEQLCKDILERVGGEGNITAVFHCITRLRIVPRDRAKIDLSELEGIDGILRVMDSQGQLQFVIGTHVNEVYEEFCEIAGLEAQEAIDEDLSADDLKTEMKGRGQRLGVISRLLDTLAAIVTPALWAIVAGGHDQRRDLHAHRLRAPCVR